MTSLVRGRRVLRLSLCSHRTTLADVDRVFEALRSAGAAADAHER
jgi:aromatic-L-amino-acid decarboxylase